MFQSANLKHSISKQEYKALAPSLRGALLDAQYDLLESRDFSVVVVVAGPELAGKSEALNDLQAWMDMRHVATYANPAPTTEELERPRMWRFWRNLPPKGRISLFYTHWYAHPIRSRVRSHLKSPKRDDSIDEIQRFEAMLAHENVLVLKFWFHMPREIQHKRLAEMEHDAPTRWKITRRHREELNDYDKIMVVAEDVVHATNRDYAPWIIINAADRRYRTIAFGQSIAAAIRKRLDAPTLLPNTCSALPLPVDRANNLLSGLDMTKALDRESYKSRLGEYQGQLARFAHKKAFRDRALVAVFEGNDAAGKGGAIRRIVQALDARQVSVVPVAAPTDEEAARPYLWRFWRRVPSHGCITLFDRSWYGRVLVERIEGFCQDSDWLRAYGEINDFEGELAEHGVILAKFWLAVTPDEQLRRFKERETTGFKRHKLTEEDWRNRDKWHAYVSAACDMIDRTSMPQVPWTLVEANDKHYARVKVLKTICHALRSAL